MLETRRAVQWTVGLPIALTERLEHLFIKVAGREGYEAALCLSMGCAGSLALRLYRWRVRTCWIRGMLVSIAWGLSVLGLAWFGYTGWWALALVPYLRYAGRLRAAPLHAPEPEWAKRPLTFTLERLDYVSLAMVGGLFAVLLLHCRSLFPFAPDGYYHLLVARRIAEDGLVARDNWLDYIREGIVPRWDWWEFAPSGRPHLYPPLLHVLIAVCSLPFGKDVAMGMRAVQVVMPPLACLTTWYLARWLFDARRGFVTVLLTGMNVIFMVYASWALPSILANILLPTVFVLFLSKRFFATSAVIALGLYTHMGVMSLTLLGLGMFTLLRREYLVFFLRTAGLAIVIALPWYVHIWTFRDWFQSSAPHLTGASFLAKVAHLCLNVRSLLTVDLLLMLLVVRAWRMVPWSETRYKLTQCCLVGFLPMLFYCGGRFFIHTAQLWAILAAVPVMRLLYTPAGLSQLPSDPSTRRAIRIVGLAVLCPSLVLWDQGRWGLEFHPAPSGWTYALTLPLVDQVNPTGDPYAGSRGFARMSQVGAYIRRVTAPTDVIHALESEGGAAPASLAVCVGYHANRRVAWGSWGEVRPPEPKHTAEGTLESPRCYVSRDQSLMPAGVDIEEVAGFYVGLRKSDSLPQEKPRSAADCSTPSVHQNHDKGAICAVSPAPGSSKGL